MAASSCSTTRDAPEATGVKVLSARHPAFEQTNSMVILDEKLVLKCYRRLRQGINPEIEVGRYLTDVSPYPHIAPVLGALQFCDEAGRPTALAVLQRYVHNRAAAGTTSSSTCGATSTSSLRWRRTKPTPLQRECRATAADSATASPAIVSAPAPSVARLGPPPRAPRR
jgi:predicted trehalose synthase